MVDSTKSNTMHWRLVMCTTMHAILGMTAKYHYIVLNPLESNVIEFLQTATGHDNVTWLWGCVSASHRVGCFIGALLIRHCADKYGRRVTVVTIMNLALILGSALQGIAVFWFHSVSLLIIGRILTGIAGTFANFLPVFVSECCTDSQRGVMSMLVTCGCPLWYTVGALVGAPQVLGSERICFVIPIIPACLHMLVGRYMHDSPKHLYMSANKHQKARRSLRFYHGKHARHDMTEEQYVKELALTKPEVKKDDTRQQNFNGMVNLTSVLHARHLRIPFFLCILAELANRPVIIVVQYSTGLLQSIGIDKEQGAMYTALLLQLPMVFASMIALLLAKHIARRTHLLSCLCACLAGLVAVMIAQLFTACSWSPIIGILGVFINSAGGALGATFIPKFLPGELCPTSIRSLTSASASLGGMAVAVVIIAVYPVMFELMGAWAMFPLIVLGGICTALLFPYLPETSGRSLEDIMAHFKKDGGRVREIKFETAEKNNINNNNVNEDDNVDDKVQQLEHGDSDEDEDTIEDGPIISMLLRPDYFMLESVGKCVYSPASCSFADLSYQSQRNENRRMSSVY